MNTRQMPGSRIGGRMMLARLAALTAGLASLSQADADDWVRVRLEVELPCFSPQEPWPYPPPPPPVPGPVVTEVNVGDVFCVTVFLADIRVEPSPQGVFASYIDVQFDPGKVSAEGAITYSSFYPHGTKGTVDNALGVVLDAGSFYYGATPPGPAEQLQLAIPFQAKAPGVVEFVAGPPTPATGTETLLFGVNEPIPSDLITYVPATVSIRPPRLTGIAYVTNGTYSLSWTNVASPVNVDWRSSLERSSSWEAVAGLLSNNIATVAAPTNSKGGFLRLSVPSDRRK